MTRLALQPRWWAWHLALVAVLVSFGWLGWWQLQSFERPATPATPAGVVELERVADPGGRLGAGDVGRRVRAEGTWDAARQLLVPGRELDGRLGSLVVTPLRTAAGVLPVVRGWVPEGGPAPAPPRGAVVVVGVVQPSETEADAAVGPGRRAGGEVAYVATVALLERLPYAADELYDGYVVLRGQQPPDPAGPERVGATRTADGGGPARWRNLAYALQWWVFAGAAVFLWWSVLRRAAQEQAPPPSPDAAPGSLAAPRRTT
jgi:cytochrome oxidase assembly protein ShyY1